MSEDEHERDSPRAEGEEEDGGSERSWRGGPFRPQIPSTASPSKASQVRWVRFRPGLLARGRPGAFDLPTWLISVQAVVLSNRERTVPTYSGGAAPASHR